jgi:hypothetical protein
VTAAARCVDFTRAAMGVLPGAYWVAPLAILSFLEAGFSARVTFSWFSLSSDDASATKRLLVALTGLTIVFAGGLLGLAADLSAARFLFCDTRVAEETSEGEDTDSCAGDSEAELGVGLSALGAWVFVESWRTVEGWKRTSAGAVSGVLMSFVGGRGVDSVDGVEVETEGVVGVVVEGADAGTETGVIESSAGAEVVEAVAGTGEGVVAGMMGESAGETTAAAFWPGEATGAAAVDVEEGVDEEESVGDEAPALEPCGDLAGPLSSGSSSFWVELGGSVTVGAGTEGLAACFLAMNSAKPPGFLAGAAGLVAGSWRRF